MDPFFTEEQLNNVSRENMMEVIRISRIRFKKRDRGTASERQAERTGIYERNAFRPSCACTKKTFRFFQ